jgi:hypothetical protein
MDRRDPPVRADLEATLGALPATIRPLATIWTEVEKLVQAAEDAARRRPMWGKRNDAADVFAPRPPLPWLVDKLVIPGPPTLVGGYGFAGKTVVAQAMAVAMACEPEKTVWGRFPRKRRVRVLHLDYEQGSRLTSDRYQRIARAMGLVQSDLDGWLMHFTFPGVNLAQQEFESAVWDLIDRFDAGLLVIDSLKNATPGIDENASEIREVIHKLALVSETTGCAVILIHHAGKIVIGRKTDLRSALRGSSAIWDEAAIVLGIQATDKNAPKIVTHDKERNEGMMLQDFALLVEDVPNPNDPKDETWGLRVCARDIAPDVDDGQDEEPELDTRIVELVRSQSGRLVTSQTDLCGRFGSKNKGMNDAVREALNRLELAGRLSRTPRGKGFELTLEDKDHAPF